MYFDGFYMIECANALSKNSWKYFELTLLHLLALTDLVKRGSIFANVLIVLTSSIVGVFTGRILPDFRSSHTVADDLALSSQSGANKTPAYLITHVQSFFFKNVPMRRLAVCGSIVGWIYYPYPIGIVWSNIVLDRLFS